MNGDINFTHTDWLTLSSNCSYEKTVLNDFKKLNMSSLQSHASSLDIFLSNNANLCSEILEEKSFSDHKYLLAEISIEYAEQEPLPKMKRLNIGKANWKEFTINFNFPMSSFDSVDNIVDSFYHKLEVASSIAIPLKTSRRTNAPFYMSSNSIHLENKLRTALKNAQNAEKISRLREELSISLNNDKKNFVEKSKVWSTNDAYKLMRQITKQPALPEKMVYMEKEVFGYKSIADCFNNYFASVFVQDETEVVIPFNQSPEIFLDDIQFSKAAMSEEVKNIRSGANSSDGISPKFLKSALPYISNQLLFILSCCVSKSEFPSLWKKVHVRPHLKSGSKLDIKNYRPIAMLSSLSLLFERMVYKQFSIFLQQKLCVEQHGFRENRSTITQLLVYCNRLYELLEANKMPMTVYLDIAKAFDTINYNIILVKLCRMGFDSAFFRFFASYLTDRQQRVVISCGKSDFRPITSGGPQGSIFTVFLFSVYINDLPEIIVNECFLYADDTKIVSTVDNKMQLEKDIENAIVWSKENRLNVNFDKFKNVQFSLRKNQNKQILRLPSHRNIPQEIHFKDLGIYFSENLSWDYHLSFVLRKAYQKLAYLKRSIPSETKLSVKCNLVKTYIISILFYGSNVWFASKTIVRQMERLQRKSLKWIQSNSHFTDKEYNDCLRSVNLLPITYQIVFLDLVVLNRILTRKLPLEAEQFWQIRNGHPKTRSNEKIFVYSNESNCQRCRSNFFQRVTNFKSYNEEF